MPARKADCLSVTLTVKVRIPINPLDHKTIETANKNVAALASKLKDVLPPVTEVSIGKPSFSKMDAPAIVEPDSGPDTLGLGRK